MTRRAAIALVALLAVGCDARRGTREAVVADDAGTLPCALPAAGCRCEPDQPAIDCYLPPERGDGCLICTRGTRRCRGGVWSACESVRTYRIGGVPGQAALVSGPTACNACDPACAVDRDVPTDADLTPERSEDAEYDAARGGVAPRAEGMATPALPDTDGDGVPDVADECDGPGAFRAADGSCYGDTFFYHSLPYGGPVVVDPLSFGVQVRTADVYFLMDTTGSMGGEIDQLKRDLTVGEHVPGCGGGIIGAVRCTMPDAWFGVGRFDDYPVSPHGSGIDVVFQNLLDVGPSFPDAQAAVNTLSLHSGADGPESNGQALWALATGGGLGPYLAARTDCPAGRWGYPCFRDGAIPIVVHFTDAPYHNGPYGYPYGGSLTGGLPLPSPTRVSGNDGFSSAHDAGDVSDAFVSFTGDSCRLSNRVGGSRTCGRYSSRSGDAVFRLTLSRRVEVAITLQGTSSTYPTITLYDDRGRSIECQGSWMSSGGTIRRVLDPGTYHVVLENYWRHCGDYRVSFGNPAVLPSPATAYPVSWADTVDALVRTGTRVITVHSGGSYGREDADALADASGSLSGTGARYVFPIDSDGTGLSDAVVDAVIDLANYSRLDVTARAVDDPATAIDERGFVEAITARGWGRGSCAGISSGTTFLDCLPGTELDFDVGFRNDFVPPTGDPQVFDFFVEVVADGTFVLERVPVRIVVPPTATRFAPEARYWRDHHSTDRCADNERPDWGELSWELADLPDGTEVRWELRAADEAAALDAADPVAFTTPSATSPIDVGDRLRYGGGTGWERHLRVTAVLRSSADRAAAPVLRSMAVRYLCVPTE
ncbi:MAG TPA: hypothetical protein RMH99_12245 [Sandaracinaceae bacterium LLY-WYZ-13_1]|nr:hypothetical protein [Sandaracinaceae bacterium LLY-WYZ-13_1]